MTTFVGAVNRALHEAMADDTRVFVMGEDVAHYGGMFRATEGLLARFGEQRVIDTPISESAFLGMALGAALSGKRPVAELMFFDFSLVAADPLLNQIAKTALMTGGKVVAPLVVRTQGGGYKGAAAQHSQMLEALFVHVPGLKVFAPSRPADAFHMLKEAILDPNPVLFVEHKQLYGTQGEVPAEAELPGRARTVRQGSALTVVSYSYAANLCEEACQGLDVDLIDLRYLNPLDFETVAESVRRTHRALIVHEAHGRCGIGADLAYRIQEACFDDLDAPVRVHAAADHPIPFAKSLEFATLPTVDSIRSAMLEAMG